MRMFLPIMRHLPVLLEQITVTLPSV